MSRLLLPDRSGRSRFDSRHELTTAMQHLCTSPEGKVSFNTGPVHVKSG